VLGEKYASVDLLLGTGLGKPQMRAGNKTGDAVIIRDDGLRIVVEITASYSASVEAKMARWAKIIDAHPLEASGLIVLFVVAPHPDVYRKGSTPGTVMTGVRKRMAKVLRAYPSHSRDAPPARMGLVAWNHWFPATHCFSPQFLNGTVETFDALHQSWSTTDLFLDIEFCPWEGFDATAVHRQAQAIGATPHWMRTIPAGDILGLPSQRTNIPCPSLDGTRYGIGVPLNATVGPTRPPARLHDPLGVNPRSSR